MSLETLKLLEAELLKDSGSMRVDKLMEGFIWSMIFGPSTELIEATRSMCRRIDGESEAVDYRDRLRRAGQLQGMATLAKFVKDRDLVLGKDAENDDRKTRALMIIIEKMIGLYQNRHAGDLSEDMFKLFELAKRISYARGVAQLTEALTELK